MSPWLQTGGVVALAILGIGAALRLARLPKPCWVAGYCLCLAAIVLFAVARHTTGLEFVAPFSWITSGRVRFALTAILIPILVLTPAQHLSNRRIKMLLAALTGMAVLQYSVFPFLMPACNYKLLSTLKTNMDRNGVCLQSTDYTCGPSAAVTVLRKLGLQAEEGELAICCKTTWFAGTPSDILAEVLRSRYHAQGLTARLMNFQNVADLKQHAFTIAVIKYGFLQDHFVAILDVTDQEVIVADPISGITKYTHDSFARIWRFSGIVVQRERTRTPPDKM